MNKKQQGNMLNNHTCRYIVLMYVNRVAEYVDIYFFFVKVEMTIDRHVNLPLTFNHKTDNKCGLATSKLCRNDGAHIPNPKNHISH